MANSFEEMTTAFIKRNAIRGHKEVEGNKIPGSASAVRSLENNTLEVGDEFTIPANYKLYAQPIGNNTAYYMLVEVTNKSTGVQSVKQFFPSSLTKSAQAVLDNGMPDRSKGRVKVKGSAVAKMQEYADINDALSSAFAGHKISISNIEYHKVLRYGSTQIVEGSFPTYDLD